MKNYLKLFVPFTLAIVIGSLTFAFAQAKAPKGERGNFGAPRGDAPGSLHPRLLEQLNLTDAQKTQISALQEAARASSQTYFERLRAIDDQLKTLVESGGAFNEQEARRLITAKAEIQIEIELVRLKTDASIRSVLTAAQIAQLEQLRQQHHRPPFRPDAPPQN